MSSKSKQTIEPGAFKRAANIEEGAYDAEKREVRLSFSSETPVRRWYGHEILSHDTRNVDLSSVRAGAPLLKNHDPEQHIGTILSAEIRADRKGEAVVKLSRKRAAQEAAEDIADGILRAVSVGYETTHVIKD